MIPCLIVIESAQPLNPSSEACFNISFLPLGPLLQIQYCTTTKAIQVKRNARPKATSLMCKCNSHTVSNVVILTRRIYFHVSNRSGEGK
jgi:hypothetical protein